VVPDRPYFFLPTLLFFQRDWLCDPIFSGWLRAAHTACQNGVCCHTNNWTKLPKFVHRKYASLVNIDVGNLLQIAQQKTAKAMKKIFKKKMYFRPTDPNFFTIWNRNHRYFFLRLMNKGQINLVPRRAWVRGWGQIRNCGFFSACPVSTFGF
jgi:hypothetical protein